MVLKSLLYFYFFCSAVTAFANVYDTGQTDAGLYSGPNHPFFRFDRYQRRLISQDDYDEQYYFISKTGPAIFEFNNFLMGEFSVGAYCPQSEFKKVEFYDRYLTRLLIISYLFEAFREYEFSTKLLVGNNSCLVDWQQTFKKCQPKSEEMKLFLKNLKHPLKGIQDVLVPFELSKSSQRKKWLADVKKNHLKSLGQHRLKEYCRKHGCRYQSEQEALKAFDNICKQEKELLLNVCSEEDQFYGASYVPEIYPLLLRSNAMRAVGKKEYQAGCLRRFIQVYKGQEERYLALSKIFSFLYSHYLNEGGAHERGRLFSIGSLKEFVDKGLDEIFEVEPKPTLITKVEIPELPRPKFEEIILPKLKKKKKKRKKIKIILPEKKEIRRSAFYTASMFRRNFSLNSVSVDMDKFKYDYTFTLSQQNDFDIIVNKFASQQSLKDMKAYDKLGTKAAPIPLRFIKYLIDKDLHQGLFNIIFVLGDEFYVLNDIDKEATKPEYISIKNDHTTQFRWQIDVKTGVNVANNTKRPGK